MKVGSNKKMLSMQTQNNDDDEIQLVIVNECIIFMKIYALSIVLLSTIDVYYQSQYYSFVISFFKYNEK